MTKKKVNTSLVKIRELKKGPIPNEAVPDEISDDEMANFGAVPKFPIRNGPVAKRVAVSIC